MSKAGQTRKIDVIPAYGGQGGKIEVFGCDKYSWLRLHPNVPGTVTKSGNFFEWCVDSGVAKSLRDVLIELYPLPVKPAAPVKPVEPAMPKVRHEVGANAKVYRIVPTVREERFVVAEFTSGRDAEAFANMKNAEA
jgi:hypothetical protein